MPFTLPNFQSLPGNLPVNLIGATNYARLGRRGRRRPTSVDVMIAQGVWQTFTDTVPGAVCACSMPV